MVREQVAGDFDYESGGEGYAVQLGAPTHASEALVRAALGDAATVISTSEPGPVRMSHLIARSPRSNRLQRCEHSARPISTSPSMAPPRTLSFPDDSFDAAIAHRDDPPVARHTDAGLRELRRVSRGPVVILTFDGDGLDRLWLAEYAPELVIAERRRYPAIDHVQRVLGGDSTVLEVPIPIDCTDGFTEAYYARPERFLDDAVRRSQSAWGFVDAAAEQRTVDRLADDLASGAWDERFGALRTQPEFVGALRLITALPN